MVRSEVGDQHANEEGGDVENTPKTAEQDHNDSESSSSAGGKGGRCSEKPEDGNAAPELSRYGPEDIKVCRCENTVFC